MTWYILLGIALVWGYIEVSDFLSDFLADLDDINDDH